MCDFHESNEALPPMIEKPYVFRAGRECKEGTCVHAKGTGYNCAHIYHEGTRYIESLSFNNCDCAAVKEVDSTIPFIFKTCPACFEGACVHAKVGGICEHVPRDGSDMMWAQSFNTCFCRTVKKESIEATRLFENNGHTIQGSASDLTKRAMTNQAEVFKKEGTAIRVHDYSNKYMPSHCCACGLIRGSKEICVPMPMFEVVQRVEHYIEVHTMVASRRYELEKPAAIVPQIYRGNLSPLYPVTWGLIGGPLAQRRRT